MPPLLPPSGCRSSICAVSVARHIIVRLLSTLHGKWLELWRTGERSCAATSCCGLSTSLRWRHQHASAIIKVNGEGGPDADRLVTAASFETAASGSADPSESSPGRASEVLVRSALATKAFCLRVLAVFFSLAFVTMAGVGLQNLKYGGLNWVFGSLLFLALAITLVIRANRSDRDASDCH